MRLPELGSPGLLIFGTMISGTLFASETCILDGRRMARRRNGIGHLWFQWNCHRGGRDGATVRDRHLGLDRDNFVAFMVQSYRIVAGLGSQGRSEMKNSWEKIHVLRLDGHRFDPYQQPQGMR